MGDSNEAFTLAQYIEAQDQLQRDAREMFPYEFSTCSYERGYVKQQLFACLTCEPVAPSSQRGGICYSCSISCHGEHQLVELFDKRAFRCDCGTDRLGSSSCCLRKEHSPLNENNKYNQNFDNIFCFCAKSYDPDTEEGTMYQCLICEDWFHDRCISRTDVIPEEDDFEHFVCSSCVGEQPWLRRYLENSSVTCRVIPASEELTMEPDLDSSSLHSPSTSSGAKRSADVSSDYHDRVSKMHKSDEERSADTAASCGTTRTDQACSWADLPMVHGPDHCLFLKPAFRDHICRCEACAVLLRKVPAFETEEPVFDPPEDADADLSVSSQCGRVIEATLNSLPRDKAIEGVLAFNQLKEHITSFLKPLAETGDIVTVNDVERFFRDRKKDK